MPTQDAIIPQRQNAREPHDPSLFASKFLQSLRSFLLLDLEARGTRRIHLKLTATDNLRNRRQAASGLFYLVQEVRARHHWCQDSAARIARLLSDLPTSCTTRWVVDARFAISCCETGLGAACFLAVAVPRVCTEATMDFSLLHVHTTIACVGAFGRHGRSHAG